MNGGYTITSDDLSQIDLLSKMSNILGLINQISLTAASVILPGDPGHVISAIFAKMFQSMRYLLIFYSYRLELMFISCDPATGFVCYAPAIPNDLILELHFPATPGKFGMYRFPSRFLYNFWTPMLFLAMTIAACIIFGLIELLTKSSGERFAPYTICKRLRVILQNFLIAQIYNLYGDILLFSTFEFRNTHYYNGLDWLSFGLAILFVILGLLLFCRHALLLRSYQKIKRKASSSGDTHQLNKFKASHIGVQIFFDGFKDSSILSQLFLLLFVLRSVIISIVLGCLFEYPLVQAIVICFLTVVLGVYLIIKRPFKKLINIIQQLTFELIFLTINGLVMTMAILDETKNTSISLRESLSNVILYGSLGFNFLPTLFVIIKASLMLKDILIKKSREDVRVSRNDLNRMSTAMSPSRPTRSQLDLDQAGKNRRRSGRGAGEETLQTILEPTDLSLEISKQERSRPKKTSSISKKKRSGGDDSLQTINEANNLSVDIARHDYPDGSPVNIKKKKKFTAGTKQKALTLPEIRQPPQSNPKPSTQLKAPIEVENENSFGDDKSAEEDDFDNEPQYGDSSPKREGTQGQTQPQGQTQTMAKAESRPSLSSSRKYDRRGPLMGGITSERKKTSEVTFNIQNKK